MGTRPAALRSFEENHPLESNSAPVRVVNWCRPAGTWVYCRNRLAVEALPFAAGIPPKRTAGPLSLTQDRRALGTSATVKNGPCRLTPGEDGVIREPDPTPNGQIDSIRYFWNEGAKIAKARYQASSDYVWAFDVNVVKITFSDAVLDNSRGNQPIINNTPGGFQILSAAAGVSPLQASHRVTMVGPTKGAVVQLGVKYMMVGYTQILTANRYRASYTGHVSSQVQHVVEGGAFADSILKTEAGVSSTRPWYYDADIRGNQVDGDGLLLGSDYFNSAGSNNAISMSDRPFPFFPSMHPGPKLTSRVEAAEIEWDFDLMVSVGTSEEIAAPAYPLFRRQEASWKFLAEVEAAGTQVVFKVGVEQGISVVQGWRNVTAGRLAFGPEVQRSSNGDMVWFNDAINAPAPWRWES